MEHVLWHMSLNSGHGNESPRSAVNETEVAVVSKMLVQDAFDLPKRHRCVLTYRTRRSFEAEIRAPSGAKVLSMGFAAEPVAGALVWDRLVAADEPQPPEVPWLAVRHWLAPDHRASEWLEFERCLAWAFFDIYERSANESPG